MNVTHGIVVHDHSPVRTRRVATMLTGSSCHQRRLLPSVPPSPLWQMHRRPCLWVPSWEGVEPGREPGLWLQSPSSLRDRCTEAYSTRRRVGSGRQPCRSPSESDTDKDRGTEHPGHMWLGDLWMCQAMGDDGGSSCLGKQSLEVREGAPCVVPWPIPSFCCQRPSHAGTQHFTFHSVLFFVRLQSN